MADSCNIFSKNVASRKCLPSGGIKSRLWLGQVEDRTGAYTYKPNGALSSFLLGTDPNFIRVKGRLKKGSGASKFTKSEEGALSNEQSVIFEVAYGTQHEADAIIAILRADAVFALLETNAGHIRGYFWQDGSSSAEAEEGTGTVKGDASGVLKITLKGTEDNLPIFFEAVNSNSAVSQLQASIDYLDSLVTGAEVVD
ncbi:hypothetical protein [Hymenobacter cheonanensis]|uniref:hypothetical protein n=1 Tax=Hymenobacter sp. CA2-7 TaxID=3063993 RepID=UPI0027137FF2|nr:hypothetical protein [Hymenobacter sp. CA2-7]MDO7888199.1 hypothetical protein [Hymenobacter sp. CA2-7]